MSQPLWEDMVAAAGAGPKPIPFKSLTVDTLVDVIQYCLRPETLDVGHSIVERMQTESVVKAAVASFHAHLPLHRLGCDVIKDQPASGISQKERTRIKLSEVAVEILWSHLRVESNSLQVYFTPLPFSAKSYHYSHESGRITIETRRRDPCTAIIAAATGNSVDLTKAAVDMVFKPVKAHHRQTPEEGIIVQPTVAFERVAESSQKDFGVCYGFTARKFRTTETSRVKNLVW